MKLKSHFPHPAAIASGAAHLREPSLLIDVGGAKVSIHAVLPLVSDRTLSRRELRLLLRQPLASPAAWHN
jgi:hypothetical protein